MEKYCGACKQTKDILAFGKHSKRKDGLQVYCRICLAEKSEAARIKRAAQELEPFRACHKCGEIKAIINFVKDSSGRGGRSTICTICKQVTVKEWKKKNPEKNKEMRKKWLNKGNNREVVNKYMSLLKKRIRGENKYTEQANCKVCGILALRVQLNHFKVCPKCRLEKGKR